MAQTNPPNAKALFAAPIVITTSAVDQAGNVYVAGFTQQNAVPITPGAFQSRFFESGPCLEGSNPLCEHSFVAKISADGTRLIYATYLGGNGTDRASAIAADAAGSAYVTGTTSSNDFPVTPGAYQGTPGDAFLTKLSPDGRTALASTYLSGANPFRIALGASGDVYVAGSTTTNPFATTAGAFQTTPQGAEDAFVLRIDSSLHAPVYSTLLGGGQPDFAYALAVDGQGNAYLAGSTASGTNGDPKPFPVTPGAYGPPSPVATDQGGGFVAKLSSDGSRLIFSSVFGGGTASGIAVDASGAVYVEGYGPYLPSTAGAFLSAGSGFAAKLSADGRTLIYATHLPRTYGFLPLQRIEVIGSDHLLVWDRADTQVATTPDSPQPCSGGSNSGYLLELNSGGTGRVFATYLGFTVALNETYVWFPSPDSNKILDRMPIHGFGGPAITCVANSATLLSEPVSPGEVVALFGPGIGPDEPATMQLDSSGKVSTYLGGLSVYFNGVAAPLLYVSRTQINAVVPFELAGWTTTSVAIIKDNVILPQIEVPAVPTWPGIFSVTGSVGTVFNDDWSVNSQSSSARFGSIVTVFATGAGLMQPPPETGSVGHGTTTITSRPSVSVLVTSGFHVSYYPAEVLYAGDAPSLVQGVVQINFRLPDPVSPSLDGAQKLQLSVGEISTQTDLWLSKTGH